jgi:hypothetical protein
MAICSIMAVVGFGRLLLFIQIICISLTALMGEIIANSSKLRGASIFDQYLKFEEAGQTENMTEFYGQASLCETKMIQNGQTLELYDCVQTITTTLQKNYPEALLSQWNRSMEADAYKLPVCNYLIEKIEGKELDVESESDDLYATLQLRIAQYNCSIEHPKLKGGSSIEVVSNGPIQDFCDVTDRFDGTYTVECRLHLLHRAHEAASTQMRRRRLHDYHLQLCTNITAYVDFEHFDAFTVAAALYNQKYPLLRYPITIDQEFCHKLRHHHLRPISPENATALFTARNISNRLSSAQSALTTVDPARASAGIWTKVSRKAPLSNLSATASLTEIMAEKSRRYAWEWLYDIIYQP